MFLILLPGALFGSFKLNGHSLATLLGSTQLLVGNLQELNFLIQVNSKLMGCRSASRCTAGPYRWNVKRILVRRLPITELSDFVFGIEARKASFTDILILALAFLIDLREPGLV